MRNPISTIQKIGQRTHQAYEAEATLRQKESKRNLAANASWREYGLVLLGTIILAAFIIAQML